MKIEQHFRLCKISPEAIHQMSLIFSNKQIALREKLNSCFLFFLEPFCKAIWDSFYCWPSTQGGKVVSRPCSVIFASFDVGFKGSHSKENGDKFNKKEQEKAEKGAPYLLMTEEQKYYVSEIKEFHGQPSEVICVMLVFLSVQKQSKVDN
ncbi:hypothetical protein TNCV_3971711 [Trichonephila clavipes]|nr:hypothetical protein TNCV_3971711 [Trichonephila clavipes]